MGLWNIRQTSYHFQAGSVSDVLLGVDAAVGGGAAAAAAGEGALGGEEREGLAREREGLGVRDVPVDATSGFDTL